MPVIDTLTTWPDPEACIHQACCFLLQLQPAVIELVSMVCWNRLFPTLLPTELQSPELPVWRATVSGAWDVRVGWEHVAFSELCSIHRMTQQPPAPTQHRFT